MTYAPNEVVCTTAEDRPDAPPGATYTFMAGGAPRVKERPRSGRNGVTYTPKATQTAERILASQYNGPCFVGPVDVDITYEGHRQIIVLRSIPDHEWHKGLKGDLDNYVKLTLDALQKANAFRNDVTVARLAARKSL
jgi:Holliday junction resolvase RusA-like endonuclease